MKHGEPLVEITRAGRIESVHSGHAVIVNSGGDILEAWGDPDQLIYPRSSAKIIQALPLVESGAADAFGLSARELSLSCASHRGAAIHTDAVRAMLARLGLEDGDLRCGPQEPADPDARVAVVSGRDPMCQAHNNCSGKHAGFLTLTKHLGADPEYVDPHHPVQIAVRAAFEEVCEETSPGFGIDGCSAPNFAVSLRGLARAMAAFADPKDDTRGAAMKRLIAAKIAHPEMVSGEDGACTHLIRACDGRAVLKTGAEGVYVAILPGLKLGIALKISDGATRASQSAIAALLVRLGVLAPDHPAVSSWMTPTLKNFRALKVGQIRPVPGLTG
jgi:L-asparaginase II